LFNEVRSFYNAYIYKDVQIVKYTEIKLEGIIVSLQWNEFCWSNVIFQHNHMSYRCICYILEWFL